MYSFPEYKELKDDKYPNLMNYVDGAHHDLGPNCLQRLSTDNKWPLARKVKQCNFSPYLGL